MDISRINDEQELDELKNVITPELYEVFDKLVNARNPSEEYTRLTEGLSGAVVSSLHIYDAQIDRMPTPYTGYAIAKVDSLERGTREFEKHKQAKATAIGRYIPDLLNEQLIGPIYSKNFKHSNGGPKAYVLNVYSAAHNNIHDALLLNDFVRSDYYTVDDVIDRVRQLTATVFSSWHDAQALIASHTMKPVAGMSTKPVESDTKPPQRHKPQTTLFEMLMNVGAENRIIDLESRFKTAFGLDSSYSYIEFKDSGRMPNPIAFILRPELWLDHRGKPYNVSFPFGVIHGDCHAKNILFLRDVADSTPFLIDLANYNHQGIPFFDVAYLELDLLLRSTPLGTNNWSTWLALTEFVTGKVLPGGNPRGADTLYPWDIIMPLRQHLAKVLGDVETVTQGGMSRDFEASWWLSAVAVGILFARRRTMPPVQCLASLIYAGRALERALDTLRIKVKGIGPVYELKEPLKTSLSEVKTSSRRLRQSSDHLEVEVEGGAVPMPDHPAWIKIALDPSKEIRIGDQKFLDAQIHKVHLPKIYYMSKTPITQLQYKEFLDAHLTYSLPKVTDEEYLWNADQKMPPADKFQHPVVGVNALDAAAYASWLETRMQKQYPGCRVMLPSEIEWEHAARGYDGRIFAWRDGAPSIEMCNFGGYYNGTTPVEQFWKAVSPYGCFDMCGNVWEWTRSILKPYEYDSTDGREDTPRTFDRLVLRGGCWQRGMPIDHLRCAFRNHEFPETSLETIGFRLVMTLPEGKQLS